MAEGLRALMEAAEDEPLSFRVVLYCGGLQITGRIAPSNWWYQVTLNADRAAADHAKSQSTSRWRSGSDPDRDQRIAVEQQRFQSELNVAAAAEATREIDELTLIDVWVYHADLRSDTSTGGQSLPVARIPLSSIDLWYIFSGETLKQSGTGTTSVGWGVLFPIG